MGQKTNPNILRLGKTKDWRSKYLEKKATELPTYNFKNIEIEKFIVRFFENKGLNVKICKSYHSESSLHVYIAYYSSISSNRYNQDKKNKPLIKTKFKTIRSEKFQNRNLYLRKKVLKNQFYLKKTYNKTLTFNTQLQKSYLLSRKTQKLNSANMYQTYLDGQKYPVLNSKNKNLFIQKIIKALSLFTEKKQSIHLNLKQLNREKNLLSTLSKSEKHKIAGNLAKFRRFQQDEFFKKGINLLYNFVSNAQSSKSLAKFITLCLRKIKRPNFFLKFLKTTLKLFITKKFSKFERIQVKIKGRFNGAPRATSKFLNIGKNIPVLTINSKIDYDEETAYTSNGTFGVKVWTYNSKI